MSEQPNESLVRAIAAKHEEAAPSCALCKQPIATPHAAHQIAVIAERVEPLFVRAERWCEGCATLIKGVGLFRHVMLRKEDR